MNTVTAFDVTFQDPVTLEDATALAASMGVPGTTVLQVSSPTANVSADAKRISYAATQGKMTLRPA